MDNKHHIDINKLNEICIISPNKIITNFEYIPIFHRNGSEKKSETSLICHFSILIDMLCKVYSEFKHLILKLSDIVLNLTELQDNDIETYMNMTTSEYIKLLKEKDKELNQYKSDKKILKDKLNTETFKNNYRCTIVSEIKNKFFDDKFEDLKKLHEETIENMNKNHKETMEKSKKHYKKLMNKLKLNHAETIGKIGDHSKTNLERRTTNPSIPSKVECLRIYINKIDLNTSEDTLIDLYSNRCQRENLKNLDLDRYEVIYNEELLANSVELYNNFFNEVDIEYTRVNSGRIQIERQNLDQFVDALTFIC